MSRGPQRSGGTPPQKLDVDRLVERLGERQDAAERRSDERMDDLRADLKAQSDERQKQNRENLAQISARLDTVEGSVRDAKQIMTSAHRLTEGRLDKLEAEATDAAKSAKTEARNAVNELAPATHTSVGYGKLGFWTAIGGAVLGAVNLLVNHGALIFGWLGYGIKAAVAIAHGKLGIGAPPT